MKKRCGAKTRSGGTCRNWAMANGRCRLHGGKSLAGPASPSFKHGRHSKWLPKEVAENNIADGYNGAAKKHSQTGPRSDATKATPSM
jgi:hypothetical protein